MSKAFVIIFFFTVFTSEASQGLNNDSLKISSVTRLFKKAFKNEISKLEIEEINVITGSDGDYVDMDWNSKKWTVYLSANQSTIMTDSYLLLICHEYGHIISNSKENLSNGIPSDEAVADFWAAKTCAPRVWQLLSPLASQFIIDSAKLIEIESLCHEAEHDTENCIRTSKAAYELRFMSPDFLDFPEKYYELQVSQDNLNCTPPKQKKYPLDTQCSFNTFLAGAMNKPKPHCINLIMSGIRFNPDGTHNYTGLDDMLSCPVE